MKVHYFNILLIALPLNILVGSLQKNPSITQKRPPTRLLCECELYSPANYDNDSQMKSVIDNFNKQTQQRLHEYDERMKTTRQKCKEQCDKDIQKIILKDKIEKELMEKFSTLHPDIQSDSIPTCVCEMSMADKVEKTCLKCGSVFGGIAPSVGLLGGLGIYVWKPGALKIAIDKAIVAGAAKITAAGLKAGNAIGMEIVIKYLEDFYVKKLLPGIWGKISNIDHFTKITELANTIITEKYNTCSMTSDSSIEAMCETLDISFGMSKADGSSVLPNVAVPAKLNELVGIAKEAANAETAVTEAAKKAIIKEAQEKAIEAASTELYTTIGYSVLAILIIVLIMVIIYKILRYRRKKKMKKKHQYIKLLQE
ncbi:PIR protein, putative [Plasmodium sp. gorilla clade G1]|nr:PIR protein, putative [Plasmodium sp. gorilla clade G1]